MGATDTPLARELLLHAAGRLAVAGHGERGGIVREVATRLGISVAATYAALKRQTLQPATCNRAGDIRAARKARADRQQITLSRDEALAVSAYLQESTRANGKVLADIDAAVTTLRANGRIVAGRADPATGEFLPLSTSAVARALRAYGCHPTQLCQPAPKVQLASEHPNHCWQIDPSLCVLFYLRSERGLRAMPRDEFYKNKPKNLARVENERVWRYVFTDHASGAIYVEYVLGAESGQNLCETFINAMQSRGAQDPFCGVPKLVMVDPGSANTGAMFKALCAALGVVIWINQPGQPWAKGGVEKANDLVEKKFEHRLKFHAVDSLAELNEAAWAWMRGFNAHALHSRTGVTRYEAWMRIRPDQLVLAPSVAVSRSLANSAPETRRVDALLRVSWRGKRFDVSRVPGVCVGQTLTVARNAFADASSARVLCADADGRPVSYIVNALEKDTFGFYDNAVPLGTFRAVAETPSDTQRRAVERVAMEADTDDQAAERRKAKALPFGGTLDPYKAASEVPAATWMPRRGTQANVDAPDLRELPAAAPLPRAPRVDLPRLSHVAMARELKPRIEARGGQWSADLYQDMATRWPDGVQEQELEACAVALLRGGIQLIAGGAA